MSLYSQQTATQFSNFWQLEYIGIFCFVLDRVLTKAKEQKILLGRKISALNFAYWMEGKAF